MAVTAPTLPTAVDYSVAPTALRTVPCVTAADFTAALADATYGDKIVLTAGNTFTGEFQIRTATAGSTTGTGGDNWVTIISSAYASLPAAGTRVALADASNMPTIVASNSSAANKAISCAGETAHHYRFVGINFTTPQVLNYSSAVVIDCTDRTDATKYPHHFSFERCILNPDYDYGCVKGFSLNGSHMQVVDSYITNCKQIGQGDANAIFGFTGAGPYKIHNNRVEGMGENIFFGSSSDGGVPITPGFEYRIPADITITNNYIRRPLSWKKDHSTYIGPTDTNGAGTISTSSAAVTHSTAHSLSTNHTTAQVTTASTTIDIGVAPLSNGFSDPNNGLAYGYLGGTDFFIYTGTTSTAFTGVTGIGQTWALGTWVTPIARFIQVPTISEKKRVINCADTTHSTLEGAFSAGNQVAVAWRYNSGELTSKNLTELKAGQRVLIANNVFENGFIIGQPTSGLTFTPREYGWVSDVTVRYNKFISVGGTSISMADYETGAGFGPSPYGLSRLHFHNNLYHNPCSAESTSLFSAVRCINIGINSQPYGYFTSQNGGTITAGATTGSGVTFTATVGNFTSTMVGQTLGYLNGRATITGFTNSTHVVCTITVAFADTSAHNVYDWFVGPAASILTRYTADSWVFEHNTLAGTDITYTAPTNLTDHQIAAGFYSDPVSKATNFVWRNNLMYSGSTGGATSWGFAGIKDGSFQSSANTLFDYYADSATSVWNKNVYFGPETLTVNNMSSGYSNFDKGPGPSSSLTTMFHDPDHAGGNGSSSAVGFTDHANGDYRVTGTYATAATDGTMIGADVGVGAGIWANTINGTSRRFIFGRH